MALSLYFLAWLRTVPSGENKQKVPIYLLFSTVMLFNSVVPPPFPLWLDCGWQTFMASMRKVSPVSSGSLSQDIMLKWAGWVHNSRVNCPLVAFHFQVFPLSKIKRSLCSKNLAKVADFNSIHFRGESGLFDRLVKFRCKIWILHLNCHL